MEPVNKCCEMCQAKIDPKNYQHVKGYYFCGSPKDCLTVWLQVQYAQTTT